MISPDAAYPFGRTLVEFQEGQRFRHQPGKTILESDNNLFSLLTMNHHPVHLDHVYAEQAQHGRVLVVGTLVFALVVGLTVRDISGRAVANLGYDKVRHHAPVHVGDTLHAESTVLSARPSRSRSDRGIVKVKTEAFNQDHVVVLSFERDVLVPVR